MRSEKEVRKAISHIAEAMLAAPREERDGPIFRGAYMVFITLAWALKHPDGKPFEGMLAGFEKIDNTVEKMLAGMISAAVKGVIQ